MDVKVVHPYRQMNNITYDIERMNLLILFLDTCIKNIFLKKAKRSHNINYVYYTIILGAKFLMARSKVLFCLQSRMQKRKLYYSRTWIQNRIQYSLYSLVTIILGFWSFFLSGRVELIDLSGRFQIFRTQFLGQVFKKKIKILYLSPLSRPF